MISKRGQFFILASLIISTIIASFAVTQNYARINREPEKFYDLTTELKQETLKVIDYGVYNNEEVSGKINDFTEGVANYVIDKDPNTEFIFIYGNKSNVVVENYGKRDLTVSTGTTTDVVHGAEQETQSLVSLYLGGAYVQKNVTETNRDYTSLWRMVVSNPYDDVVVNINQQNYTFNIGRGEHFLLITRKDVENDTYIKIE